MFIMNGFEKFTLDRAGVRKAILVNNGQLQSLERSVAELILSEAAAQFFQTFGIEGKFELTGFTTDRSTYKISAADAATGAILKANPKWLDQFTDSVKI